MFKQGCKTALSKYDYLLIYMPADKSMHTGAEKCQMILWAEICLNKAHFGVGEGRARVEASCIYFNALVFERKNSILFFYYKDFLIFEWPSKCLVISGRVDGWTPIRSSRERLKHQHCTTVKETQESLTHSFYHSASEVLLPGLSW